MSVDRQIQLARAINALALLGLLGVLTGSLFLQLSVGEQPCPLCLVQRSGMIGLAVGPLLNLLWGIKARNYAISILAAVTGGEGSVRQVFLHIANNTDPGYGPSVLGLHLYTWAAITFVIGVVGCAVLLLWQTTYTSGDRGVIAQHGGQRIAAVALFTWVSIYLVIIAVTVIPECGVGMCPDDPADISGMPAWAFGLVLLVIIVGSIAVGLIVDRMLLRRRPVSR